MSTFTSSTIDSDADVFRGLYKHTKGTETKKISDTLITTEDVAEARAKAELLKYGYNERSISLRTVYIQGLKQNDIIQFKGKNWIVKEISLSYSVPTLISTIKGVRYE